MNKRNFLKRLALGIAAGFIAPSELTDRALWIPNKKVLFLPSSIVQSGWTEGDVMLYNRIPFYFVRLEIERNKNWETWIDYNSKLTGNITIPRIDWALT